MLYADINLVLADAWADVQAESRAAELAALADLIANQAHPRQRDFVLDPAKRICALVGRGGGKTTGGMFRLLRVMLTTPRAKCLYIATTREQAEKLLWAPLKELCSKLNIAARFYEDRLRCVFRHNGATLSLAGADDKKQIEKYRGIPHHEVGVDECASYPPRLLKSLIEAIIEPRLGDYDGTLWLIGTPGHPSPESTFYDVTRPGATRSRPFADRDDGAFADWANWSFHEWTLPDAVEAGVKAAINLWAAALVTKRNNGWSDDHPTWRREYLGQWAADFTERVYRYRPHDDAGKPFNQWDPPRYPSGRAKLPEKFTDWVYVYGMDFGSKDPFALEVFAYSPTDTTKTLYHVFEFEKRGMYARPIAALLLGPELDLQNPTGIVGETGWPDRIAVDGSAQTLIDELLNVYGIKVEPAPRKWGDKLDSIELFNGDLQDGRIKVLKGSKLEDQLVGNQWAQTEHGDLREDKGARNDCADAAIYARRLARHLLSEQEAEAPPYFPERKDETTTLPWERPRNEFAGYFEDDSFDDL